jgi:hypothetical protein
MEMGDLVAMLDARELSLLSAKREATLENKTDRVARFDESTFPIRSAAP